MTRPLSLAIQDGLILLSHYIIQNQTYQRTSAEPAKCFQRRQVKTGSFLMSLLRKSWVRLWKKEYCFGKKNIERFFRFPWLAICNTTKYILLMLTENPVCETRQPFLTLGKWMLLCCRNHVELCLLIQGGEGGAVITGCEIILVIKTQLLLSITDTS